MFQVPNVAAFCRFVSRDSQDSLAPTAGPLVASVRLRVSRPLLFVSFSPWGMERSDVTLTGLCATLATLAVEAGRREPLEPNARCHEVSYKLTMAACAQTNLEREAMT